MTNQRKPTPCFEGRVQAWGNSMGLRITRAVGQAARLEQGTRVTMELTEQGLLIRPLETPGKTWTAQALLESLDAHNAHADELPVLLGNEYSD